MWYNKNIFGGVAMKIETNKAVLEELKKVLSVQNNVDNNSISLYSIEILRKYVMKQYEELLDRFRKDMKSKILRMLSSNGSKLLDFNSYYDYENKKFRFFYEEKPFYYSENSYTRSIDFFIKDNELYFDHNLCNAQGILLAVGNSPLNYLSEFMKFENFNLSRNRIESTNCDFDVFVWPDNVSFGCYRDSRDDDFEFYLPFNNLPYDRFKFNSTGVMNIVNSNKEILFRNIFVKIDDCPMWVAKVLNEIGRDNLNDCEQVIKRNEQKILRRKKVSDFFNMFGL